MTAWCQMQEYPKQKKLFTFFAFRKLSFADKWTNLVVHVTTEDGIVVQEISK